jgi:hypothetical protein
MCRNGTWTEIESKKAHYVITIWSTEVLRIWLFLGVSSVKRQPCPKPKKLACRERNDSGLVAGIRPPFRERKREGTGTNGVTFFKTRL